MRNERNYAWTERGEEGTSREVPWRTLANIQYTVHTTTHNAALALVTLVLKNKNSEPL